MFIRTALENVAFFAKIISIREISPGGEKRDFWNSFLAGITKNPTQPPDPLADLHLRNGTRPATVKATMGMVVDPANPGTYHWLNRQLKPNPNEHERALGRSVVHQTPMYSPEEKGPFSKHQSTALIHAARNVRPRLFLARTAVGNPCGVLIPAPIHFPIITGNEYALLNRMIKYDGGTFGRPYDLEEKDFTKNRQLSSYNAIYADPDLLGITGGFTEILARLRWYKPSCSASVASGSGASRSGASESSASEISPTQPAILICASNDSTAFYQSVLLSLRRAFDLKFALFRKFNVVQNIPIVIYHNTATLSDPLKGYFILGHDENLDALILQIINAILPPIISGFISSDMSLEKQILMLQKGLDKLLRGQEPDENFDVLLKNPNFTHVLYLETLRSLIHYGSRLKVEGHPVSTLLHPDNPIYSSQYRDIYIQYTTGTPAEQEERFFQFGFQSDFCHLPTGVQAIKINPRFLSENHPDRLFGYISVGESARALALIANPTIHWSNQSVMGRNALSGALVLVCEKGLSDVALAILRKPDVNVNHADANNNTALMWAIVKKLPNVALAILEKPNVNVNVVNSLNNAAFNLACLHCLSDVALAILRKPDVNVNHADENNNTALMWAITNKLSDVALAIIEKPNVNINVVNSVNNTALNMACLQCLSDVALAILRKQDVNVQHDKTLIWPIQKKLPNVALAILCKPDVNVNHVDAKNNTALIWAISNKLPNVALAILEKPNVNLNVVNSRNNTALNLAYRYCLSDVAHQILSRSDVTNIDAVNTVFESTLRDSNPVLIGITLSWYLRHHIKHRSMETLEKKWHALFAFQPSNCSNCHVKFNLIYRRHHCRGCGNVFCGNCSSMERVEWLHNNPTRFCGPCSTIAQAPPS